MSLWCLLDWIEDKGSEIHGFQLGLKQFERHRFYVDFCWFFLNFHNTRVLQVFFMGFYYLMQCAFAKTVFSGTKVTRGLAVLILWIIIWDLSWFGPVKLSSLGFNFYELQLFAGLNLQVMHCTNKDRSRNRVSVQGVKSLGGHFACLCQGFDFYEVKKNIAIIIQKENVNTFTLLIIFLLKSL